MTDLHEIFEEQMTAEATARAMWSEQEADALLRVYLQDKLASVPSVAMCYIDRTATVGAGSHVWHYARVLANARIGTDVSIGGGTEIGRGCVIGDGTRIGANCFFPPNSIVGSNVFIGPGCVFTDDKYPRCGNANYDARPPVIHDGASIGAGSVILPGVVIGAGARVAAGSKVTSNVRADVMVLGSPAREQPMPLRWSA